MARIRSGLMAVIVAGLVVALAACGGDDTAADPPATTAASATGPAATAPAPAPPPARPAPAPLPGLPADTAGFDGWTRLNAAPIPPDSAQARRVGFDAHRGTKDVYVNRPRAELAASPGAYPDGTIVVKAAGDGGLPTLVAIMRKVAGSDPEHGDWRFVEYKRDGADDAFATDAGLRDATCWGCHATAMDTDWVFTALEPG